MTVSEAQGINWAGVCQTASYAWAARGDWREAPRLRALQARLKAGWDSEEGRVPPAEAGSNGWSAEAGSCAEIGGG